MNPRFFCNILKSILTKTLLVVLVLFFSIKDSNAVTDLVRTIENVTDKDSGFCKIRDLVAFDPNADSNSTDMEWEIDNPVCAAYLGGAALQFYIASTLSNSACLNYKANAELAKSISQGVGISPKMAKEVAKNSVKCGSLLSAGNYAQAGLCCGSLVASGSALGVALAELGSIYTASINSERHAHVCGAEWNRWRAEDASNIPTYNEAEYALENNQYYVYGKSEDSYNRYLERAYLMTPKYQEGDGQVSTQADGSISVSGATSYDEYISRVNNSSISDANKVEKNPLIFSIKNKEYREFLYGGLEYEDKGEEACKNPSSWSPSYQKQILGFSSEYQRYYMRGPRVTPNYACGRFLLKERTPDAIQAYECCKNRSQTAMCIEETGASGISSSKVHEFCKVGTRCNLRIKDGGAGVWYSIHNSKFASNYICAETYSVCPFNHKLGGGTEIAQYSKQSDDRIEEDNPYGIILNHCQYLKHCVRAPDVPYIRTSDLGGEWLSPACFDLKGDSQNNYEFNEDLLPLGKNRNFSAPIAQCFKETIENLFFNKAGTTKCLDPDESPDNNGVCVGGYVYKAGEPIENKKSFFQTLQDSLQGAVRVAMTVAITIAGFMVLLSGKPWDKKTIIMFVIKLSLVVYFALGTAWQDFFIRGVFNISTGVSEIFMSVTDDNAPADKQDGCQFPKYNYAFEQNMGGSRYDLPSYPLGKEYLKIWDALDCKIARAIGFGPEVTVPNLIMMIFAGLLWTGFGVIFVVATFIFAFYLIALTIRALHIFLVSSIAITILVYVSPITITGCLFKKTESIFKAWQKQLVGFTLQPIILFAYLGVTLAIFQYFLIGDAVFTGDGLQYPKSIDCSVGNAANNSLYCIFRFNQIGTNNALAPIGIALPVLLGMTQEKLFTIIEAAFIMFILSQMLNKITDLASQLTGGSAISSGTLSAAKLATNAYGISSGITTRGTRALRKLGSKFGVGAARSAANFAGGSAGAVAGVTMGAGRGTYRSAKSGLAGARKMFDSQYRQNTASKRNVATQQTDKPSGNSNPQGGSTNI